MTQPETTVPPARVAETGPAPPSVLRCALAAWLRYAVPLSLLSAIALAPVIAIALRTPLPANQAEALGVLVRGWGLLAPAWLGQLVLVGAAAAILRARPSQLRAFTAGLGPLVRAIVPCLAAVAAIATASLALVVPGLVLLVLLSLTAASTARGLPAPLVDSVAVARAHPRAVVLAAIAMLAIDAGIVLAAQRALVAVPLPRAPSAAQLAMLPVFARAVALALVLASPLPALALAAIHVRAAR